MTVSIHPAGYGLLPHTCHGYDPPMMKRLCEWCGKRELPVTARADARFCGTRCQVAAWRAQQKEQGVTPQGESVVRADCPECGYPGLMHADSGDMFPHRMKGSSRAKVCTASDSLKRPVWERHGDA